jgi:hypothetical protein
MTKIVKTRNTTPPTMAQPDGQSIARTQQDRKADKQTAQCIITSEQE